MERPASGDPLPPPISTGEPGSFAMRTITRRKPLIADQVLQANDLPADARGRVAALKEEIAHGLITDPFASCGIAPADLALVFEPEERAAWRRLIAAHLGRSWVGIPWYAAEAMFYLRLLFATGYFSPSSAWFLRDPFQPMKDRELRGPGGGIDVIRRLCGELEECGDAPARLVAILTAGLWGNRVDLSLSAIAERERENVLRRDSGELLVDDIPRVVERLLACRRVDLILDNCGAELVSDLALADALLCRASAREVVLHLKRIPFYVSDAMEKDARETIAALTAIEDPAVASLGGRLASAAGCGRLSLREHHFWSGPLHFDELPEDLLRDLGRSDLVLAKGDANYRRLLADRRWEPWASMEAITRSFPAPFAVLRTMKSPLVVDLPAERFDELTRADPEWMVNGRRGIVRLCGARREARR